MAGSTRSLHYKSLKRKAGKVKTGRGINKYKKSVLFQLFNCETCPFRGTTDCFHNIPLDGHHSNGICSERILLAKEVLGKGKGLKEAFRQETAIVLNTQNQSLFNKFLQTGKLDEKYLEISKELIKL